VVPTCYSRTPKSAITGHTVIVRTKTS